MSMDEHQRHIYLGEPDEDLVASREPDQLVEAVERPVPRRKLSRRTDVALSALRIFLVLVSLMVIYVFVVGTMNTR
jgi:hypothetical protein